MASGYIHTYSPNEKVGNYLVTAFTQPETQRRSCFACRITTEAKLARNHHPASNYSHPFANMPQLPILDFFSLNNSLKARSLFARAQKNGKSPQLQQEGATQVLPIPRRADENPEGCWRLGGRCSAAFRAARGLACAHELPLSDFPTAELQPSPCPCLKNFLNSIPVLFLTALKPHCLYFNKALSGQVTATGLAPDSN